MAVSIKHRYLAIYINVVGIGHKHHEFATSGTELPQQIAWCCDEDAHPDHQAVVVSYASMVLVVGMTGDSNINTYDSSWS